MAPDEPKQPANKPADRESDAIEAKEPEVRADAKAADASDDEARKAREAEEKAARKAKEAADEAKADEEKAAAKAREKAEKAKREAEEDKREAEEKAKRAEEKRAEAAREAAEELTKPPKAPPWYRTLRADPPAHMRLALGGVFIALIFLGWWALTRGDMVYVYFKKGYLTTELRPSVDRIISASTLPSPFEVFGSFSDLMKNDLLDHFVVSLARVLKGIGLAVVFGVGLGVLAASHRGVNAAIMPLVIFLRSVPMGALIPLTVVLFGITDSQKVRFIFIAVVPFVFSDTVRAISIVPDRYVETAQTLGASRFQIIYKVLFPLALPEIVTNVRFMLGLALGYITLAEQIDPKLGLGFLIDNRLIPLEQKYMLLFVIAFVAFSIDLVLRTLQRGAFGWRKDL